jgi:hypothetical protein
MIARAVGERAQDGAKSGVPMGLFEQIRIS